MIPSASGSVTPREGIESARIVPPAMRPLRERRREASRRRSRACPASPRAADALIAQAMDHQTDTTERRAEAATGRRAHGEIDRLLARIRRLVRTREGRRLEGAGDAEMAASSAEIGRLQARLADAVRRQLAAGDERPAPRRADR